jgi:intracellular septation protein A
MSQQPDGTAPEAASSDVEGGAGRGRSPMLSMVYDVVPSVATYYGLRILGADPYVALLGATAVAALRLLYVLWTDHTFDRFAAFMVVIFAIGLALSFVTGDPRFLLMKDSVTTAVSGLIFGASWLLGRPLMLTAVQRFGARSAAEALEMEDWWRSDAVFRHMIGVMSVVWALGLIGEAAVRIPLIYLLPIDVMAGLSTVLSIAVLIGLFVWTQWYGNGKREDDATD